MHRILWTVPLLLAPVLWAAEPQDKPKDKPKAEKPKAQKPKPDEPKPDKPPTRAEQLQAVMEEYQKAQQEFFKSYQEAKTDEERQKLAEEKYPRPEKFAARVMAIAEADPKDAVSFDAVLWVVNNVRGGAESNKFADRAVAILIEHHIENENLKNVVQQLAYSQSPGAEKLLRLAMQKSPHREVQGYACFGLAQFLKNKLEGANYLKNADPQELERIKGFIGEDMLKQLTSVDPDKAGKEIESLCEKVIDKYADLESFRGKLGEAAERELFEIRNLAIGRVAPEIEGEDLDGAAFKLTDYRGKVVVLDFWGDW